ncbi:hypothetical protein Taro_048251 [Colocasia esculenta]|uniref:Uncharacterized protein n=1 Tax=Colocasia esculenta TaxID=4460 RepID=A0A843X2D8_COLES|nr:hypothetical protein [Colocasia esculenta]
MDRPRIDQSTSDSVDPAAPLLPVFCLPGRTQGGEALPPQIPWFSLKEAREEQPKPKGDPLE